MPPFSITIVHRCTKEPQSKAQPDCCPSKIASYYLIYNVPQPTVTWNLVPTGVTVGLRNISARKITVPSRTIVCQIQLTNMVLPIQTSKEQPPTEIKKEEYSCILDQLDLGEINTWSVEQQQAARKLLCDYS